MDRVNHFLNNWGQDLDVVWVEEEENFLTSCIDFCSCFQKSVVSIGKESYVSKMK